MKNKLIYIGGSIKSGSTLLGAVLGNNNLSINIGEFVAFKDKFENNSPIFFQDKVVKIRNVFLWSELNKNLDLIDKTNRDDQIFEQYKFLSENFKNKTIIDSSKSQLNWTLERFKKIKKTGIFECYFIHLIRKPEAVVFSQTLKKSKNASLLILFKEYLKWICTNLLTTIKYGRNSNYLKIRYEEFCVNPINQIELIEKFTKIDFSILKNKIRLRDDLFFGYSIDGNPFSLRQKKINKIQFNDSYKEVKNYNFKLISFIFRPITLKLY
jgi:hypothetical protein